MKGSVKWLVGAAMTTAVMGLTGAAAFADTSPTPPDFSGTISFTGGMQPTSYQGGADYNIQLNTQQILGDAGDPPGSEFHVHGLPPYLTFDFQQVALGPTGSTVDVGSPMSATGDLTVTNSVYNTDNVGSMANGVYSVTTPTFPVNAPGTSVSAVEVWATLYVPPGGVDGGATPPTPDMWQSIYTGAPTASAWVESASSPPSLAQYTSFAVNEYDNDDPISGLNTLVVGSLPEVPLAGILPGLMVLGGAGLLIRKHRKNSK